jgi:hypothetical protein
MDTRDKGSSQVPPLREAPHTTASAGGAISLEGFDEVDHSLVEADAPPEAGVQIPPPQGPVPLTEARATGPQPRYVRRTTGPKLPRPARATGPGLPRPARATGPELPRSARATGPELPRSARATGPELPRSARATGPELPRSARATGPELPRPARPTGPEPRRASATFGSEALEEARRTSRLLAAGDLKAVREAAAQAEALLREGRDSDRSSQELEAVSGPTNIFRLALVLLGLLSILGMAVVLVLQITSKVEVPDDSLPDGQAFMVETKVARRGEDLTLVAHPPCSCAQVYFNGREMETRVVQHGRRFIFTIPQDARDGHVEFECGDQRHVSRREVLLH